jgi:pantoate--beta-alanine ligase
LKVVEKISDLVHPSHKIVGFVPTMGALHEGHLELMRRARAECEFVVVSIFVNPTQFGPGEDFERYPRTLAEDLAKAEQIGVDTMFVPSVTEMYGEHSVTSISVRELTDRWEGAIRPGHFNGVATVVTKLLNMVRPDVAYFGQKDLQQCLVVRRVVQDLNMPVEIKIIPTVREIDGLAMSSRNRYLTGPEREVASLIYRELSRCATFVEQTGTNPEAIRHEISLSRDTLNRAGFNVDYFEWVNLADLSPMGSVVEPGAIIAAAKLGSTRLLDNILCP